MGLGAAPTGGQCPKAPTWLRERSTEQISLFIKLLTLRLVLKYTEDVLLDIGILPATLD